MLGTTLSEQGGISCSPAVALKKTCESQRLSHTLPLHFSYRESELIGQEGGLSTSALPGAEMTLTCIIPDE